MILGAVVLLLVAMAFVAAELFIPSHGLLAVFAALAAIASVVMAAKASASLALVFGLIIFIATPIVFYWAIKLYPRSAMGKRVMLDNPDAATAGKAFDEESARLAELVGRQGVATTMLRPAGSVEVAGRRVDALSDGDVIKAGTKIEVVRVNGLTVFVKTAAI